MGIFFDCIIMVCVAFLTINGWCRYLDIDSKLSLGVSTAISVLILLTCVFILAFIKKHKKVSKDEFFFSLAVQGNIEISKRLSDAIPKENILDTTSPYIILLKGETKNLLVCCFKFSEVSPEDVVSYYRYAKEKEINNVIILSRGASKQARMVANRLPISYSFPTYREIKNYFITHCIYQEIHVKKHKFLGYSLKSFFDLITDSARIKYYAFSSIILLVTAFFTPLKLYYLLMSIAPALLLTLAVVRKTIYKS